MSTSATSGPIRSMPAWLVILICLIYLVSPIDIVPDFIPLAGQADDLVVLGITAFDMIRRMGSSSSAKA